MKSLTDSHKGINTGGRRLRSSTSHSREILGLVDTRCLNPGVILSHWLEAPAIMKKSRSSGRNAMSLCIFLALLGKASVFVIQR
jgi:hypothetical protein